MLLSYGRCGTCNQKAFGCVDTLRPRQNCRFADDIFKCIFLNENVWISLKISLKISQFVPNVLINYIPSLVKKIAWCRPCYKPLSEPMMVSLLTHICVTQPQWVNRLIIQMHLRVTIITNFKRADYFTYWYITWAFQHQNQAQWRILKMTPWIRSRWALRNPQCGRLSQVRPLLELVQ